jgi:DHA2 family multidrug resistance protein
LPQEEKSNGIGIFQSVRLISGAIGCIGYPTLWFRRRIFYHDRLGEQLTPYSEETRTFLENLPSPDPALLEKALDTQASALALADCFYFMGWIMVIVLFLFLLYCFLKKLHVPALP